MSEELKPCPFCGGKAEFAVSKNESSDLDVEFKFYIRCLACNIAQPRNYAVSLKLSQKGVIMPVKDEREMAVKAWNRRTNDGKTD
jgi:Lar family restriction alleviation protein